MAGDGAVPLLVHAAEGDQHVPALQGGESAFATDCQQRLYKTIQ